MVQVQLVRCKRDRGVHSMAVSAVIEVSWNHGSAGARAAHSQTAA